MKLIDFATGLFSLLRIFLIYFLRRDADSNGKSSTESKFKAGQAPPAPQPKTVIDRPITTAPPAEDPGADTLPEEEFGREKSAYGEPPAFSLMPSKEQPRSTRDRSLNMMNWDSADDGSRKVQTTKRHLWLLGVNVGDRVSGKRLASEIGIEPVLGWHKDRSINLAALVEASHLNANNSRLQISPADQSAVGIARVARQAVPILSADDDGWRFEGFFRVGSLDGNYVACVQIVGLPPELVELRRNQNG